MAYIHFQKFQIFKSALNKWDEKETADKTWPNFKIHLRSAHKALRRTGALTIEETLSRDQVMNIVTDGVVQAFNQMQPPSAHEEVALARDSPEPTEDPPSLTSIDATSQSANATTVSDLTVQTLQRQMEMLQSMMTQLQCMPANNSNGNFRRGRRSRQPQHGPTRNPNQCKYCWTHGLCSHFGRDCRSKAEDHQDEATKDNRMGGSVRNIPLAEQ